MTKIETKMSERSERGFATGVVYQRANFKIYERDANKPGRGLEKLYKASQLARLVEFYRGAKRAPRGFSLAGHRFSISIGKAAIIDAASVILKITGVTMISRTSTITLKIEPN